MQIRIMENSVCMYVHYARSVGLSFVDCGMRVVLIADNCIG